MRYGLIGGGFCMVLALGAGACDSGATSAESAGGAPNNGAGAPSSSGAGNSAGSGVALGGSGSGAGAPNAEGGASGGVGTAGSPPAAGAPGIVMNPPSTYPQNSTTAKYPFPQGHASTFCKFPNYNTDKVQKAYTNWKTKFFVGGKVIRPENNGDTVSEGIAYGMLIGVYMNDQPMFDTLWKFAQSASKDSNGFMNWNLSGNGGGATDADEDMAYALLQAGVQWGGTYNADAVKLIDMIFQHEVESGGVLKPGDNFGGSSQTNPSYLAPSYYRAFAKANPGNSSGWMAVIDKSYAMLAGATGANGLVPNWSNAQGQGVEASTDSNGKYYGYDACRTPFRIALDYCQNGEPRAKAYIDKLVPFMNTAGGALLAGLKDGYTTTGTNPPGSLGDNSAGLAFIGPVGVAAMGGYPTVASGAHFTLTNVTNDASSSGFNYFNGSWGMLSLLALSGNFWNMAPQ